MPRGASNRKFVSFAAQFKCNYLCREMHQIENLYHTLLHLKNIFPHAFASGRARDDHQTCRVWRQEGASVSTELWRNWISRVVFWKHRESIIKEDAYRSTTSMLHCSCRFIRCNLRARHNYICAQWDMCCGCVPALLSPLWALERPYITILRHHCHINDSTSEIIGLGHVVSTFTSSRKRTVFCHYDLWFATTVYSFSLFAFITSIPMNRTVHCHLYEAAYPSFIPLCRIAVVRAWPWPGASVYARHLCYWANQ